MLSASCYDFINIKGSTPQINHHKVKGVSGPNSRVPFRAIVTSSLLFYCTELLLSSCVTKILQVVFLLHSWKQKAEPTIVYILI